MVSQLVQAKIDGETSENGFKEVKKLYKETSGFGWDEKTQLVTAEDSVWEVLSQV